MKKEGFLGFKKRTVRAFRLLSRQLKDVRFDLRSSFDKLAGRLEAKVDAQQVSIVGTHRTAVEGFNSASEAVKELNEQLKALRLHSMEQQSELKRYQEGYNWSIIKDFGQRIIRVIDEWQERTQSAEIQDAHRGDIEAICTQLVYALDGAGVEQYGAESGDQFDPRIHEKVKEDTSSDAALVGLVSAAVSPGYCLYVTEDNPRIIRPAKVQVYSLSGAVKQPENGQSDRVSEGVESYE